MQSLSKVILSVFVMVRVLTFEPNTSIQIIITNGVGFEMIR